MTIFYAPESSSPASGQAYWSTQLIDENNSDLSHSYTVDAAGDGLPDIVSVAHPGGFTGDYLVYQEDQIAGTFIYKSLLSRARVLRCRRARA